MSSKQQAVGSRQLVENEGLGVRGWGLGIAKSSCFKSPSLCKNNRRAFTLVELLVVILILAILAGLITVAAIPAVRAARRMVVVGEITQLNMGMERYKQQFTEFPPDFSGLASSDSTVVDNTKRAILRHLRQAFPQYVLSGTNDAEKWDQFRLDVKRLSSGDPTLNNPDASVGVDVNDMTPAGAIVFWLGGVPTTAGTSTKLIPMSTNPANPFYIGGTSGSPVYGSRLEPFFEFDEGRLIQDDHNICHYKPPYIKDRDGGTDAPPYVYFRASKSEPNYDPYTGSNQREQYFSWGEDESRMFCAPYIKNHDSSDSNNDTWFNPKTCQIICCGFDGMYAEQEADGATEPIRPQRYMYLDNDEDTSNFEPEEDDNLTNFSKGNLGDWNERK